jgi:MFS superfamily sulfate permease-like transporter
LAVPTVRRSKLSRYSSILMMALGVATILFVSILVGMILTAVGLLMYFLYRRIERRSQRLADASGGATPTVIKEKEVQVVVRVPCKHCGTLNDQLRTKCESCGAPLN